MKITCSILCYNYGRFLPQAIESCLNQIPGDYELEVLVIDDGSTDNTPEVCQQYQGRIRVLHSENQGFGASLDKSIREATGDYICLLDADDYFAPHKLKTLLPQIKEGIPYICHSTHYIDEQGHFIDNEAHSGGNTSSLCLKRSTALAMLPVQNEIFFRPLFDLGYGTELHEPLTFYRIHHNSMSNGIRSAKIQWLIRHAQVCYALAEQLLSPTPEFAAISTSRQREKLRRQYQAGGFYDEMEAALLAGQRLRAITTSIKMFCIAIYWRNSNIKKNLGAIIRAIRGISIYNVPDGKISQLGQP